MVIKYNKTAIYVYAATCISLINVVPTTVLRLEKKKAEKQLSILVSGFHASHLRRK